MENEAIMKILTHESKDQQERTVVEMTESELEGELEDDKGLIEVIPMRDHKILVRVFFDIDQPKVSEDPFEKVMQIIYEKTGCRKEDWAVSKCHRIDKLSYHIVSKTHCISVKELRVLTKNCAREYSVFDYRGLYFGIQDEMECGYFRLPNQSKKSINKDGPPMEIIAGNVRDFFVTRTEGLKYLGIQ
jgi:hypothetical protein